MAPNLSAMIEFYFGNKIRPYFRTNLGDYITNVIIQHRKNAGSFNADNKKNYFGMVPKGDIVFNTGAVSPFIQAQYNFLFQAGEQTSYPEITNKNTSFASIDAGIVFNIKRYQDSRRKN